MWGGPQVEDLLALHVRDLIISGRKEHAARIDFARRRLVEFFGDRDPRTIKFRDVEAYKAWRLQEHGVRFGTVTNELCALRRAFRLARDFEFIETMPPVRILPDVVRDAVIGPEKFLVLCSHLEARNPLAADLVRVLFRLGWRRREGAELRWSECDLDADPPMIYLPAVRTKTKTPRRIPLPAEVLRILERRRAEGAGEYVFSRPDGRRLKTFKRHWQAACRAAGCEGTRVHDLRRGFVRTALLAGVSLKAIQDAGGWRSSRMVFRYSILDEGMIGDALRRVEAYVQERRG